MDQQLKVIEGLVVREECGVKKQQILFDESQGIIVDVGDLNFPQDEVSYSFSDDCLIFAGMGDVHIHAREDISQKHIYKEDFVTASMAALNGGVIQFFDMPNNPVPPIDENTYSAKFDLTKKSPLPIGLYAGVGPQTRPLPFSVPYKVYMGPSIGDLYFQNLEQLDQVLKYYQNQWVSFHCEDPEILRSYEHEKTHAERRPIKAEMMATAQALTLIEKYSLQGKICHFSIQEGIPLILAARKKGINVQCEVTPQHLYFDQENIQNYSSEVQNLFQMNPPLRTSQDRMALMDFLKTGGIDFLATDHAPHSPSEKSKGTSGLTGLDTYGGFVTWLLVEKKIDPLIVNQVCCSKPGKFFNQFLKTFQSLDPEYFRFGNGLGFIEKGFSASFTVLNLRKPLKITREMLRTKCQSSPFLGITFPGQVEMVFLQGRPLLFISKS